MCNQIKILNIMYMEEPLWVLLIEKLKYAQFQFNNHTKGQKINQNN